ncbi:uncharacterized protein OCT59_008111 [Rhizophagus irregularis]|uniref:Uncharacterized protein n=3 Tax=Rhizophagus irregularis TaxID=588596 RepID=A0A2I1EUI6_9GLOM|nr:hypothetical protein RirG_174740 [Rhizophagus irregularis DAOM 197198w]PKY25778.1 hypothetical protein RhiirB3_414461 [Rhizophagus irregularis]GBC42810.1 hypothetical protein RIR_jg21309.t1 [Rhizophagus irregularis DAOM 181602=DAOM 197198]UZO16731.1 hypothetical protein OCT59_008111 [Rhizophagus irregularis]CAB4377566.1 unnamed protein product [Rhizophagus irregularis]
MNQANSQVVNSFHEEVARLLQQLVANRHQYFPNRSTAVRIHGELTRGRPYNRMRMNRRKLLRFSVATSVQITDWRVFNRAVDLFMDTATPQEKLGYALLAEEVNTLIRRRR